MAVTLTHLLSQGLQTDTTTYTSASVNVTAGSIVCFFATNASLAGTAEELDPADITGTLGGDYTWQGTTPGSALASVLMNSSLRGRTTFGWAHAPSANSGTITWTFAGTQASHQWTIFIIEGADTTNPVVQVESAQTAGTNPSVTFSPAVAATSLVAGAMHANLGTAATAGSGYTVFGTGLAGTTPSIRQTCEFDDTTPSSTCAFVQSGSTNKAIIAVEFQEPQGTALVAADSAHANTADSPTLTQHQVTAPADSAHSHAAESPALTQHHVISPADTAHTHAAESPTLTQVTTVTPADSGHGHSAGSPALTQHHVAAPADSSHTHATEQPTLTQHQTLAPGDSEHENAADSPTLVQHHTLAPSDSLHAHTASSPTLGQAGTLSPDDSHHGHATDSPALTQHQTVSPDDAPHGHTTTSPTLAVRYVIQPDDATHGHAATLPELIQHHALTTLSTLHTHTTTSPTLRDGDAVTPPARTAPVDAETRVFIATAEPRTATVNTSNRTAPIPAETRTAT